MRLQASVVVQMIGVNAGDACVLGRAAHEKSFLKAMMTSQGSKKEM